MIRKKNQAEIEILREGGKILSRILRTLAKAVKPGVSTGNLETMANKLIKEAGGRPAFKNYTVPTGELYPTALCTSVNDEVVHGLSLPARVLKIGDIIGLDLGMEYPVDKKQKPINQHSKLGGYYTDTALTVAVGDIDSATEKLLKVTRECLEIGVKTIGPGVYLSEVGEAIQKHAEAAGYAVVRELVGHGVGHEAHEDPMVPNYRMNSNMLEDTKLEPGMVIAVEPMVNMGGWKVEASDDNLYFSTADGSLSAHFEHTVAVTEKGNLVITAS
jgi:methionyl aminopeptidase